MPTWFDAPVEVQVQLIVQIGVIAAAIISTLGVVMIGMLNRTRQHAKATREGVENSHDTNLRDDLDEKFQTMRALIGTLTLDMGGVRSELRTIHREAGEDRMALALERERIRLIEDTITPTQLKDMHANKEKP